MIMCSQLVLVIHKIMGFFAFMKILCLLDQPQPILFCNMEDIEELQIERENTFSNKPPHEWAPFFRIETGALIGIISVDNPLIYRH